MTQRHKVAVLQQIRGPRGEQARRDLAGVLDDGSVGELDEYGIFEVEVGADTWDDALLKAIDAVAKIGGDEELLIAEHPNVPEHWRRLRRAEAEPT